MTTIFKRRSAAARTRTVAVAGMAAVALAVAACGGSSGDQNAGRYGAPSAAASGSGTASVALANSSLGKILVDGKGRTLYLFEADKGTASACDGACASAWPPLATAGHRYRRARRSGLQARHHEAQRRNDRGHVQRAPALHVHR